jgi:hypothetical protein
MANTDFFDDDLIRQRDSAPSIKMGPGGEGAPSESSDMPQRSVSDFNLGRMARHKDEVEGQVARAAEELERLRQRQEDLEKEKHALLELRKRQSEYEHGKQELIERLNQHIHTLEKEEVRASQVCELLGATRKQFREMLEELNAISEEDWDDEHFREELAKALAVVEDARVEFNKGMAKVKAATQAEVKQVEGSSVVYEDTSRSEPVSHGFGYWMKVGVAISIPIGAFIALLLGIYLYLRSQALV